MAVSVPASIFLLCGAYIFGRVFGFLPGFGIFCCVDYCCMQVGSLLAFLNARYLFKSCFQGCIVNSTKLTAISQALSVNAKKLVALMRICSITPYWLLNCICGITNMSICDYMIGNLPIIVADVPYIYICASISDVSKVTSSNPLGVWYYVLLAVGLIIIVTVIILIYFFARRELKKTMDQIKNSKENHQENRSVPNEIEQQRSIDAQQ